MALRNRFINPFAAKGAVEAQSETGALDLETTVESKHPIDQAQETDRSSQDDTIIDDKAQSGTQKAQASTQAWTRNTLIAAYIL